MRSMGGLLCRLAVLLQMRPRTPREPAAAVASCINRVWQSLDQFAAASIACLRCPCIMRLKAERPGAPLRPGLVLVAGHTR